MDSEPHLLLRLLHEQERRDAIAHLHLPTFAASCICVDTSRVQLCVTSFASPLLVFSAGTGMPLENITSAETVHIRTLFGSAIEIALPARFEDVSDYRPVPDHQEVRQTNQPALQVCFTKGLCSFDLNLQVWTDAGLDQSLLVEIVVRTARRQQSSWCNNTLL